MDKLSSRLGTRFLAVTVVPTLLLFGYLGILVSAGAPVSAPQWSRTVVIIDGLTGRNIGLLLTSVLILSIATHPLQVPLIQLFEGYWWGIPFGPLFAERATDRFRTQLRHIRRDLNQPHDPENWVDAQVLSHAKFRQYWIPEQEEDLLPTVLGNTLRVGEMRAGSRYGLETDMALPRLLPLLSAAELAEVADRRNQLDAAVRLCLASAIATAAGLILLLPHQRWLFLPAVTFVLSWACYTAAVAAARGFCRSLATAFDLHHLDLFDALHLDWPSGLVQERKQNAILSALFRGTPELAPSELEALHYKLPSTAQEPPAGPDRRGLVEWFQAYRAWCHPRRETTSSG